MVFEPVRGQKCYSEPTAPYLEFQNKNTGLDFQYIYKYQNSKTLVTCQLRYIRFIYVIIQGGFINGVLVVCSYTKCFAYENDAWIQIGGEHVTSILSASTVIKGTAYICTYLSRFCHKIKMIYTFMFYFHTLTFNLLL